MAAEVGRRLPYNSELPQQSRENSHSATALRTKRYWPQQPSFRDRTLAVAGSAAEPAESSYHTSVAAHCRESRASTCHR